MRVVIFFFYINLGMEVGEVGKRIEKKVKRKPTRRDDELICLNEGIGSGKSILMRKLQHSVTNKKRKVWRELTAKVNTLRT